MYNDNSIKLIYSDFKPFIYEQYRSSQFICDLSIVGAIFNIVFENIKREFLK